jgi:hypothetical protein
VSRREQQLAASVAAQAARVRELEADRARSWLEVWSLRGRVAALEQGRSGAADPVLPLAEAARRIGCSWDRALALGQAGELELIDCRRPGSPRARWYVSVSSTERVAVRGSDNPETFRRSGGRGAASTKG